jgi:glycopeptide antibiotics resistance protein
MKKEFLATTFVVYLGVVAAITIIPTRISRLRSPHSDHVNLVPLDYSFRCFRQDRAAHPHLTAFCFRNTLGNLVLFLPLGILLPLTFDRWRSLKRVMAIAFCLSLSIETIQFLSRFIGSPRAVDIDDVLLNTLGACLGFFVYQLANKNRETIAVDENGQTSDELSQR